MLRHACGVGDSLLGAPGAINLKPPQDANTNNVLVEEVDDPK
jgi:hypothetical protein